MKMHDKLVLLLTQNILWREMARACPFEFQDSPGKVNVNRLVDKGQGFCIQQKNHKDFTASKETTPDVNDKPKTIPQALGFSPCSLLGNFLSPVKSKEASSLNKP